MNIKIDDLNINYDFRGEQNGGDTLVVLLHGWGSNIKLFDNLMNVISQKYPVTALDMPGFGLSEEMSEPWDVGQYTDFVIKFISGFNYKKVILLGHSFGGRVIIKMLTQRDIPFEVPNIIMVDAAGIKPKKTFKQKLRQRVFKIGKWFYNLKIVKKISPKGLDNWRKKFGSADYNDASEIMKTTLVKTVNEDLTDYISKITADALLIWGENDTATPLSDGQLMEKLIKNSGLVTLKNAGHYSFLEQQYTFNAVIKSYLKIK